MIILSIILMIICVTFLVASLLDEFNKYAFVISITAGILSALLLAPYVIVDFTSWHVAEKPYHTDFLQKAAIYNDYELNLN